MLPELERLKVLRLDKDWTWQELADAIVKAGGPAISARTLHYILTSPTARPRERTLYKLQKFLAVLDRREVRARAKRRHRAQPPAVLTATV